VLIKAEGKKEMGGGGPPSGQGGNEERQKRGKKLGEPDPSKVPRGEKSSRKSTGGKVEKKKQGKRR